MAFLLKNRSTKKNLKMSALHNSQRSISVLIFFPLYFFLFFCFVLFFFLGPHLQHMEVPGIGVKLELQLRPMPQPQQYQIQAASVTYTATCGNARSLTAWTRPGIKPPSSLWQHQALNSLSHNGNSNFFFFFLSRTHFTVPMCCQYVSECCVRDIIYSDIF